MTAREVPFWEAVDHIRARRPRYRREAYGFVMLALGHVVEGLPDERRANPQQRHVSGQELLRGVIEVARSEFGPLAPMVFREWGVVRASDVGEIVFDLVESGQLSARPEDRREDFSGADLLGLLAAEPGPPPGSPSTGPKPRSGGAPDPRG